MVDRLQNHLLIAMPGMQDPHFDRSVTLICEHTAEGALGVVINRPVNVMLDAVLAELELKPASAAIGERPVIEGGPVSRDRGFVLHSDRQEFDSTLKISQNLAISFSIDAITALAHGETEGHALFGLGYAGWESGQLEQEILDNAWLTAPADPALVFEAPFAERLTAAARSIGVDWARLTAGAGHD